MQSLTAGWRAPNQGQSRITTCSANRERGIWPAPARISSFAATPNPATNASTFRQCSNTWDDAIWPNTTTRNTNIRTPHRTRQKAESSKQKAERPRCFLPSAYRLPPTAFCFSLRCSSLALHRSDVLNKLEFGKRGEFFDGHATDDHLGALRVEHDLEAKLLELRDCFF